MNTFVDIIALWGTAAALAADLGEKPGTVRQWRSRNNIPAEKWAALIAAARRRRFKTVTAEALARIAALPHPTEAA